MAQVEDDPPTRPGAPAATRTVHHLASAKGSFFSLGLGWLLVVAPAFGLSLFVPAGPFFVGCYALVCAVIVLPLWLLVLWPLYSWVPRQSPLWSVPVCTCCGLAAGTLVSTFVLGIAHPQGFLEDLPRIVLGSVVLGGLMGGATCFCGALSAAHFLGPASPEPLSSWLHRAGEPPPRQWLSWARECARLRGEKLLRWVGERFRHLSGQ